MGHDPLLRDRFEVALAVSRIIVVIGAIVSIIGVLVVLYSLPEVAASDLAHVVVALSGTVAGFATIAWGIVMIVFAQLTIAVISIERNTRATFRLLEARSHSVQKPAVPENPASSSAASTFLSEMEAGRDQRS